MEPRSGRIARRPWNDAYGRRFARARNVQTGRQLRAEHFLVSAPNVTVDAGRRAAKANPFGRRGGGRHGFSSKRTTSAEGYANTGVAVKPGVGCGDVSIRVRSGPQRSHGFGLYGSVIT